MPRAKTRTIRIPSDKADDLDSLARRTDRPRSWHVERALSFYLDLHEWQVRQIEQSVAEMDAGSGIPHEEIKRQLAGWGRLKQGRPLAMTLVWSPRAQSHLQSAEAFIARDSPGTAEKTASRILRAAEWLCQDPDSERQGRVSNTREFDVLGTPFFLVHRVRDGAVEVLAVIHESRQWTGT